jgi:two-component system sensor histidine kinase MprB
VSFRARVTLLAATALAATVAVASVALYVVARHELRGAVDASLRDRASHAEARPHGPFLPPVAFGGAGGFAQLVTSDGDVLGPRDEETLPADSRDVEVARGERGSFLRDERVDGVHLRVLTYPVEPGAAVQLARPLTETDRALRRIRLALVLVGGIGIAVAAALAAAVAAAALRPVRRLTEAAERVAATADLGARVEADGGDELARLGRRFNEMLAALEAAVASQRRLVADASHELRTPLTSVRTNVELARENRVGADEIRRALDDALVEVDELTRLVGDLVDLARGQERRLHPEELRLDELAAGVVERARTRANGIAFETSLEPSVVRGDARLLERAVANLVDNAVKWSPPSGTVRVEVADGAVVVQDEGPGVDAADLPFVFDRFYRSTDARSKPGSGLGLAIVREAAEAHGGRATAEESSAGARFRLSLPSA